MKTYKMMIVDNIVIEIDEGCQAKDISRVRMKILEDGETALTHTTKAYAQIHGNQLRWSESLEFRYTGQTKLGFQTYCEHEFGYNLQELQVLYRGIYFIKNQMFFKRDSCHIYSPQGEKMGLLRWELKVVTREQQPVVEEEKIIVKPLVREDLIGLVKIYQAMFQVTNPIFNKKKHQNLQLRVAFGSQSWEFDNCNELAWKLNELKLEYVIDGSKNINFQMLHQGRELLQGTTACENIQKLKRYIKHKVSMFNKNGIKLGVLVLEYRYVQKKQLLDLLYAPGCKLATSQRSKSTENLQESHSHPLALKSANKSQYKHTSLFIDPQANLPANRYKIGYLMNHNSDILIPKASRFPDKKPNSPFVSYIDPLKSSDFSPKSNKGWHISRGSKFDFTRQYRGNPGVGSYKLPSIWSKY